MTSPSVGGSTWHHVYTGRTTNWPAAVITVLGAALLVLSARSPDGAWNDLALPILLVALFSLASALTAASVRAAVGPNGVTVHWGLVGWPRFNYRLDQIEHSEVVELPWWRVVYGIWWTPKRTSCTVRSGPTLRLILFNGRIVTITVPEPAAALAALQLVSSESA